MTHKDTPISGRKVEVRWTDINGIQRRVRGIFYEVNGRFGVTGVDLEYAFSQGCTWNYVA